MLVHYTKSDYDGRHVTAFQSINEAYHSCSNDKIVNIQCRCVHSTSMKTQRHSQHRCQLTFPITLSCTSEKKLSVN